MKAYIYRVPKSVDDYCAEKVVEFVIKERKPISKQQIFNLVFLPEINKICGEK
jgi:hypothetical protein